MNKAAPGGPLTAKAIDDRSRLAAVVLVRIAAAAAGEREIARDLQPYVAGQRSADAWREELGRLAAGLAGAGLVWRPGEHLAATEAGFDVVRSFLGLDTLGSWAAVRDGALVLKALGLEGAEPARRKASERLEGLRGLIVEGCWNLKPAHRPSASRLRSQLALLALERAFGNRVRQGLAGKTALSPKAARRLAGQLAKKPRQHATDARLIAQLAAEAVGTSRSDLASLRAGAIRRFVSGPTQSGASKPAGSRAETRAPVPGPALGHGLTGGPPKGAGPMAGATVPSRPDRPGFAAAVKHTARTLAEGWSGNRKALVSRIWAVMREQHADWGLSEIEFKCMLAEAHRLGLLALASADLKDRRILADIEASAVSYKNVVWHYVRAED